MEKACQLPTPHETRIAEVQCDLMLSPMKKFETIMMMKDDEDEVEQQADNTGVNQSSMDDILEYARNPLSKDVRDCSSIMNEDILERQHGVFVQQLKSNYEAELERQQ